MFRIKNPSRKGIFFLFFDLPETLYTFNIDGKTAISNVIMKYPTFEIMVSKVPRIEAFF